MKELIKRAEIAESGSSVLLADAKLITTTTLTFTVQPPRIHESTHPRRPGMETVSSSKRLSLSTT